MHCVTEKGRGDEPHMVNVDVNGHMVAMEIDTGAKFTVINRESWMGVRGNLKLQPSNLVLVGYGGAKVRPQECSVLVNGTETLSLLVAESGPNLLGRNWLNRLKLDWSSVYKIRDSAEETCDQYPELFQEGLGKFTGGPVTLNVDPQAIPKFLRARPVPFSMRDKVESELDRLVAEGILKPVSVSAWATPIVPVLKQSGEVRICGDYRSTVNSAGVVDKYPIPKVDDLFVKLSGGKYFLNWI